MTMSDKSMNPKGGDLTPATTGRVLQVERHDYPDLAPQNAKRTQPMRGFDPIYTDIVDYIVRCTHLIWDERDIGLIYSHYTHNCVLYGTTGTLYTREEVVRDTIQRLVPRTPRHGDPRDLEGERGRRLLHLAPRHRNRSAQPERPPRPRHRAHVHQPHRRRLHDL
ncbi:MAG: hypothetical protein V4583_06095 [Pseudomonadota bacterium]